MPSHWQRSCWLLALAVFCSGPLRAQEPGSKLPVPTDAEQKKASTLVKEIFGEPYRQAKSAEQKRELAEQLRQKASETTDDLPGHYVLLRLARDVAAEGGDPDLAFRAIDEMAARFSVDPLAMKRDVLLKSAAAANSPRQREALLSPIKMVIEEAVVADRFDLADALGQLAATTAREAKNAGELRQIVQRNRQIQELGEAFAAVRGAMALLEQRPTDADANLTVGKHLCFVKGNWSKGISMLALGNNEALRAVAVQELQGPTEPADLAALADAWWALAEKHENPAKEQIRQHAGDFYRRASVGLSGLAQQRVERRLQEIAAGSGDPAATKTRNRAADLAVGTFAVAMLDKKTRKPTLVFWELLSDGAVVENGRGIGNWQAGDAQIRITFTDAAMGEANLKLKGRDSFAGGLRSGGGDTWLIELQRLTVVARWQHQPDGGKAGNIALWSNGRIGKPDGKATWELKGNRLTLRWQNGWVDRCTVSSDGQFYEGKNQAGVVIRGRRLPNEGAAGK